MLSRVFWSLTSVVKAVHQLTSLCFVPVTGTTAAATSCGAASALGSWTVRMWSSCGASATPSASR